MSIVDVIIPAHDEADTLSRLLPRISKELVRSIYVVDNASTDATAAVATELGATVLAEPKLGYGAACRRGVAVIAELASPPDIVVFMDADGADDPDELELLVRPIERQGVDLVIGSRTLGTSDRGAVALPDRLSRDVAVTLIRAIYGRRFTDLGSFRAVRLPALVSLGLSEDGAGFDVEMQVKAVKLGLRVAEVPVRRRKRSTARAHDLRSRALESTQRLYTILRHATTR